MFRYFRQLWITIDPKRLHYDFSSVDGDYETSSEGHIRFSKGTGVIDPAELGPEYDRIDPRSEEEESSKVSSRKSVLIKSESMPVLQKASSNEEDTDSGQVEQTSASSLACQRKIKVIVAKMAPLLSPWSNLSLDTSITSKADLNDEGYIARKMESRTKLPVLENPPLESETYLDPSSKDSLGDQFLPRGSGSSHTSHRSASLHSQSLLGSESQADLIKIAQNAHSSIKSFYFPPNSTKKEVTSSQWRVKKDLDTLLRIDGELGPLQHKLNEITGKFRAMNLTDPSLMTPEHYSSTVSGYYLHRTETFGANKPIHVAAQCHQMVSNPSWDARVVDNPPSPTFQPFRQENISLSHDVRPAGSFIATRQVSNGNWLAEERNSFVSTKNSWFEFEDGIKKDPSGSMIPNVSSSCYKCPKHRLDYQNSETEAGTSGFSKWEQRGASEDPKQIVGGYSRQETIRDTEPILGGSGLPSGRRKHVDTLPNTLCQASTSTTAPEVHVVRVNTTVEKHYGRIIAGDDSPEETSNSKQSMNNPELEEGPLEQNVSSMILIGSSSSNKTHYVNYTRVNSQTSLIISKRDQAVGTSRPEETQLVSSNKDSGTDAKKKVRDLDVQCSGFNLRYHHQKEIVFRRSVESLLKQSPSDDTSSSSDQMKDKSEEKVMVVPVLFVDGIPEPPRIPLFKFTKSRSCLDKPNHRMMMVRKRDVPRHNNLLSDTSAESLDMVDHLRMKMLAKEQWNSGMSLSVSRNHSLSCSKHHSQVSNSASRQSDKCQRTGKGKRPGSMMSGSTHGSRTCSSSTKKGGHRVMLGLRSSPEDFLT